MGINILNFILLITLFPFLSKGEEIKIEKELSYDKYTLEDVYLYKKTSREFQWEEIKQKLGQVEEIRSREDAVWAVLQNKSNKHGKPSQTKGYEIDEYKQHTDAYGIEATQTIPLYLEEDMNFPERYALDGSLVQIINTADDYIRARTTSFEGEYLIPAKYVHTLGDTVRFNYVVVVDRENQNICTLEKVENIWKIRSMNPATTGAHHPPLQRPTPLGIFVLQQKLPKMYYYVDGTTKIGGFAPWANRFCQGAYIHGVPVNLPHENIIEYSATLGTIPRSHMCVRNVSSHAKFIYDNFPVNNTLVIVIGE